MTKKAAQILGYIRVSTLEQEVKNQKLEILEYCRKHDLNSKAVKWIELTISSRRTALERKHEQLLNLQAGDVLIATEISRLGRSTSEVLQLVNQLLTQGVRVILTKQGLDLNVSHRQDMVSKIVLTIFSMMAELERDIISLRTKEALAAKKSQGIRIGKVPGTVQRSMYDEKVEEIKVLLEKKVPVQVISRILGVGKALSLRVYLKRRKLIA